MDTLKLIQLFQRVLKDASKEAVKEGVKEELFAIKKELLQIKDKDELLSREQTARLLQINLSTLHFWTKDSRLKSYGIAGRRYYKRSEIINNLKELKK